MPNLTNIGNKLICNCAEMIANGLNPCNTIDELKWMSFCDANKPKKD